MAAFNTGCRDYYANTNNPVDNYIYTYDNNTTSGYGQKYKIPTNKYKKLCETLEKDVRELKKKLKKQKNDQKMIELADHFNIREKEKESKTLKIENKELKNTIEELEKRIEKLNKFTRFNIMEI